MRSQQTKYAPSGSNHNNHIIIKDMYVLVANEDFKYPAIGGALVSGIFQESKGWGTSAAAPHPWCLAPPGNNRNMFIDIAPLQSQT